MNSFPTAHLIREIGRGVKGARGLSRTDAHGLYAAILDGRVSDLELGAILLAMRIKGQSPEELAGFLDAAHASFAPLPLPAGPYAPVVIPTYNGARKLPNLTPLLACLLARESVPVLVHGVRADPGRVTTAEILQAMGLPLDGPHVAGQPRFLAIDTLAPRMAALLALRRVLGVRNSTHTLVKLLQPYDGPALRLVSYTHPEYLIALRAYFAEFAPAAQGHAFLMRGTEGETVASPRRAQQIAWLHDGVETVLAEKEEPNDKEAALPAVLDAATTAAWIKRALEGAVAIPDAIREQVRYCTDVARRLRN
ncbi:MAG TPA: DNA-binding protein YbiB [Burkholderiaceae bacterium]